MPDSCASCFFFRAQDSANVCARNAPRLPLGVGQSMRWPPVQSTEWCGEFSVDDPLVYYGNNVPWVDYVPVITPAAGAITAYTINAARSKRIGTTVYYYLDFTITNNGTGSGYVKATLPYISSYQMPGSGVDAVTNVTLQPRTAIAASELYLTDALGAYPTTGTPFRLAGSYETPA